MPLNRVTINIEGMAQAQKVLDMMPKRLQRQTLLKAFRKGAQPAVKAMRRITPEDTRAYDDKYTGGSGQLRESVGIIVGRPGRKTQANLYVGARFRQGVWRDPARGGWYFHFVSKGTKYQEAQLIPEKTYDQVAGQVEEVVLDELEQAVFDVMKREIKRDYAKRN